MQVNIKRLAGMLCDNLRILCENSEVALCEKLCQACKMHKNYKISKKVKKVCGDKCKSYPHQKSPKNRKKRVIHGVIHVIHKIRGGKSGLHSIKNRIYVL